MLLFFDIDGTIFDDDRHLPASVRPAMEAARKNGHRLIINTGRTLCNKDERLDDFPLDGWIMGCGTRILYHGETLQQMEYEPEESRQLRRIFLDLAIPVVYECDTAMYFDPLSPAHSSIANFREWSDRKGISRDVADHDSAFRAVKMFCFTDENRIAALEQKTAEAGMAYEGICRRPGAWEVVPAGYSKGKGIDILRKRLNMKAEECFAFGDSANDLTMFQHAGHSIAMGNATEEVKAVCTWVTDKPEHDGIAKAMKHFGLI